MKKVLRYYTLLFISLLACVNESYPQSGWILQKSGTTNTLWGVSFIDANIGTVVGDLGTILHTTDGGISWVKQESGTTNNLTSVSFTDENTGTAVGDYGTILHTTNGGTTWVSQSNGSTNFLKGVCFTNNNMGTAVGTGKIFRTTDGGTTWKNHQLNFNIGPSENNYANSVCFVNSNVGFAVGQGDGVPYGQSFSKVYSHFLYTIDGGTNWNSTVWFDRSQLYGVSFADVYNGIIVGLNGRLDRTSDGGNKWYPQSSGTTESLNEVSFFDVNTATVVGSKGTILRTTDGGTTWVSQVSGTTKHLYAVSFTSQNVGTIVGVGGIILRTTSGGTTDVGEFTNLIPNKFLLEQNYPNPFNPTTNISFRLPFKSFVSLKVFDALGREISMVATEELSAGVYTRQWNADGFASGIYFYRLQAGSFTETKKLILLR